LHILCTFEIYQHLDVRRLPDQARSTCQSRVVGMGNTYIVVSNVNLLDHVCDLRLCVGGCFDLTSSAGVVTSNQINLGENYHQSPSRIIIFLELPCERRAVPAMTGSGVSACIPSFTAETTTPFTYLRMITPAIPCNAITQHATSRMESLMDFDHATVKRAHNSLHVTCSRMAKELNAVENDNSSRQ
jgi:hypothetical protein